VRRKLELVRVTPKTLRHSKRAGGYAASGRSAAELPPPPDALCYAGPIHDAETGQQVTEGWRHRLDGAPLRIAFGGPVDPETGYGPRITGRVNQVTGELLDVEPWVNQIHPDDWEWYERHWLEMDEFEYRVRLAVAGAL
jgi:hypothetical protein